MQEQSESRMNDGWENILYLQTKIERERLSLALISSEKMRCIISIPRFVCNTQTQHSHVSDDLFLLHRLAGFSQRLSFRFLISHSRSVSMDLSIQTTTTNERKKCNINKQRPRRRVIIVYTLLVKLKNVAVCIECLYQTNQRSDTEWNRSEKNLGWIRIVVGVIGNVNRMRPSRTKWIYEFLYSHALTTRILCVQYDCCSVNWFYDYYLVCLRRTTQNTSFCVRKPGLRMSKSSLRSLGNNGMRSLHSDEFISIFEVNKTVSFMQNWGIICFYSTYEFIVTEMKTEKRLT